jgi:hypothetical protein
MSFRVGVGRDSGEAVRRNMASALPHVNRLGPDRSTVERTPFTAVRAVGVDVCGDRALSEVFNVLTSGEAMPAGTDSSAGLQRLGAAISRLEAALSASSIAAASSVSVEVHEALQREHRLLSEKHSELRSLLGVAIRRIDQLVASDGARDDQPATTDEAAPAALERFGT